MGTKSSLERFRLEQTLKQLDAKQGRHTELVTLYIPPYKQISDVVGYIGQEASTAANIKSKSTRKNVQDALETITQRLKLFKQPPPKGMVMFCGAIPQNGEGTERIEVYVLEPTEPVNVFLYRCDARFHTDILKEMIREKEAYGLLVLDRSEATFAILQGRNLKIIEEITSGVPGKHDAGGQSARRFERVIDQLAHEFYKRIGEYATKIFIQEGLKLEGLIIGGPGPTKYDFAQGEYLHYTLKDRILATVDIGYADESGVRELVERSRKTLREVRYVKEKRLIQYFMKHLIQDSDSVAYGGKTVYNLIKHGAVKTLILSEKLDAYKVSLVCQQCGARKEEFVKATDYQQWTTGGSPPHHDCGGLMTVESSENLLEDMANMAEKSKARVEIVSGETEEGDQLYKAFGGVAAMLRYHVASQ